jgi:phosphogluconate dehydratase
VPLLARVYPNGSADVNQFQAAGGPGFVMRELLDAGLLHADVNTPWARGMPPHPGARLADGQLAWRRPRPAAATSTVLRPAGDPVLAHGGLRLLQGNLGRA